MSQFTFRLALVDELKIACRWYNLQGMIHPKPEVIPDTSYFVEIEGVPAIFVSTIETNIPILWVEYLIGNPDLKGPTRKEATLYCLSELTRLARESGCIRLFCMAPNDKLKSYYEKLGFSVTASFIHTLVKEVS